MRVHWLSPGTGIRPGPPSRLLCLCPQVWGAPPGAGLRFTHDPPPGAGGAPGTEWLLSKSCAARVARTGLLKGQGIGTRRWCLLQSEDTGVPSPGSSLDERWRGRGKGAPGGRGEWGPRDGDDFQGLSLYAVCMRRCWLWAGSARPLRAPGFPRGCAICSFPLRISPPFFPRSKFSYLRGVSTLLCLLDQRLRWVF